MKSYEKLLQDNKAWAREKKKTDPDFFDRLLHVQTPEFLWIGCSDSRVPANEITGTQPGEIFVHRNVANLVVHTDLNCLSVIQYAVEVLQVKHIIVCGHYGCGGVVAAIRNQKLGLIDNWLRHVQDVHSKHAHLLPDAMPVRERHDRLCELNVIEQVLNVGQTTVVRDAWERGQPLSIHGWIYGLKDGLLHDLGFEVSAANGVGSAYEAALGRL